MKGTQKYSTVLQACLSASLLAGVLASAHGAADPGYLYVTNFNAGRIDRYDTVGGQIGGGRVVGLVSGLTLPTGVVVIGNNLFVESYTNGTIGEYNATTGAAINSHLISGLNSPEALATDGTNLFVANFGTAGGHNGSIGEYTTAGAAVNAALITGLSNPAGLAVGASISGNARALYVATGFNSSGSEGISEYNTSGGTVNASFISDTKSPSGVAFAGNDLYVSNLSDNSVAHYNATTGSLFSGSILPGSTTNPQYLAIDAAGSNLYMTGTTGFPNALVDVFSLPSGTLNGAPGLNSMDAPWGLFQVPEPNGCTNIVLGGVALLGFKRYSRRRKTGIA